MPWGSAAPRRSAAPAARRHRRAQVEAGRALGGVLRQAVAQSRIEDLHVQLHLPSRRGAPAVFRPNARSTCWAEDRQTAPNVWRSLRRFVPQQHCARQHDHAPPSPSARRRSAAPRNTPIIAPARRRCAGRRPGPSALQHSLRSVAATAPAPSPGPSSLITCRRRKMRQLSAAIARASCSARSSRRGEKFAVRWFARVEHVRR